jgi:hypothetical protein
MNKAQMEMLSVKSAIERTISGLIVSYSTNPTTAADNLYNDVCRYMASLFASQQIDRDYRVELVDNNINVSFWTRGNATGLTFLIPFKLPKQEPLGEPFQKVLDDNRWDLYEDANEPTVFVE